MIVQSVTNEIEHHMDGRFDHVPKSPALSLSVHYFDSLAFLLEAYPSFVPASAVPVSQELLDSEMQGVKGKRKKLKPTDLATEVLHKFLVSLWMNRMLIVTDSLE